MFPGAPWAPAGPQGPAKWSFFSRLSVAPLMWWRGKTFKRQRTPNMLDGQLIFSVACHKTCGWLVKTSMWTQDAWLEAVGSFYYIIILMLLFSITAPPTQPLFFVCNPSVNGLLSVWARQSQTRTLWMFTRKTLISRYLGRKILAPHLTPRAFQNLSWSERLWAPSPAFLFKQHSW